MKKFIIDLNIKQLYRTIPIEDIEFNKGDKFAYFVKTPNNEMGLSIGWHLIEITYVRLDLIFFKIKTCALPDAEHYVAKNTMWVRHLMPLIIDLNKCGLPIEQTDLVEFRKEQNCPYKVEITKLDGSKIQI